MRKPLLTAVIFASSAIFAAPVPMLSAREPAAIDKPGQINPEPVNAAQSGNTHEAANAHADATDEMPAKEMDKHFVMMAANANLFEIQLGKDASSRVKNADVKAFAEKIVADHQKSQDQLVAWGKQYNVDVPTELDSLHQQKLAHVESMKGRHFERAFVYHNVADHMLCVLMFRDASTELSSPQLRQFASDNLPVLKNHLADAEKLANFDRNEARTASDRIPADNPAASSDHKTPVTAANNGVQSNQGAPSGKNTAAQSSDNSK